MERYEDNSGQMHTAISSVLKEGFINDPGLTKTSVCNSSITWLDGNAGELRYRGYAIDELASSFNFLEVMYLLLNSELGNASEIKNFQDELKTSAILPDNILEFARLIPNSSHPMATISTLLSFVCSNQHISNSMIKAKTDRIKSALHILAIMPILAVIAAQKANGINPESIDLNISNDIHALTEGLCQQKLPNDHIFVKAIDRILTLHADHELNASTFTMRVAASTNSNPYACLLAAISALWGPAHGGANEACLRMLSEINSVDNITKYIARAKDKNDSFKLMGFGHRVYKNYDPRAKIMQSICHEVLKESKTDNHLFAVAKELEATSLSDPYFIERKLYPNVDFYSGITLSAIGLPSSMFTVIFALARTTGWISHWLEMHERGGYKIFRPRQVYDGIKSRGVTS